MPVTRLAKPPKAEVTWVNEYFGGKHNEASATLWTDSNYGVVDLTFYCNMKTFNKLLEDLDPNDFTEDVLLLIPKLEEHGPVRRGAREKLIEKGAEILPQMYKLLDLENSQLRWEAAQVIKYIASEESISILISLLDDVDFDIRRIASNALILIGRSSLIPLCEHIAGNYDKVNVRECVHYVLTELLTKNEHDENIDLLYALSNFRRSGEAIPHLAYELREELIDSPSK
ncbi:HEAT repeat domain-containing protein [Marinilabilia salmonicolor]|nr:HEAT repeat domain-containing protein [Marinilabilia salmonicolor]